MRRYVVKVLSRSEQSLCILNWEISKEPKMFVGTMGTKSFFILQSGNFFRQSCLIGVLILIHRHIFDWKMIVGIVISGGLFEALF